MDVNDRLQVWLPAEALTLARKEAELAGGSVNGWLEEAAVAHVELQRALRAQEAREGGEVFLRFDEVDR